MTDLRALARRFKAAADDTRLEILALLLRHGELCVCDVEQALGISQSKTSRHLRYLLERGFLEDRRDGLWVHYRVRRDLAPDAQAVLRAVEAAVADLEASPSDARLRQWLKTKRGRAALPLVSLVGPRKRSPTRA